jgi:hypothetical protein
VSGEPTRKEIEADDLMIRAPQGVDQRLAEMAGTPGNENFHDRAHRALQESNLDLLHTLELTRFGGHLCI